MRTTARLRRDHVLLMVMWLFGFFIAAFQILPAGILRVIMGALAVGPAAAGWFVGASLGAQALTNVPIGIAIDRTNSRFIVTLGAIGMGLAGVGAWQAGSNGSYPGLIAAIALGGMGIAAIITAGANLIGTVFAGDIEATAVAIFLTAPPAGYAVGQFAGPVITARFGWPVTFLVFGALTTGTVVPFWLISRGVETTADTDPPTLLEFRRLLGNTHLWMVAGMSFVGYSLYLLFNSWMPTYLADTFGLSLARSGLYAALFPATGVVARASGGVISDRVFGRQRRPVAIIAFATVIPVVGLIATIQIPLAIAVLFLPAGFFVQLGIGLFYTYVREVVAGAVTATALAVLGLVSFVGAFTAPAIAGIVLERTASYIPVFGYAGALALVGVALAVFGPEPNPAGG